MRILKNTITYLFVLLCIILVIFYLKNDGIYVLKRSVFSELEFINEFSGIKFPETTKINEMTIQEDIDSNLFNHNDVLKATLDVPSECIEVLFPMNIRIPNEYSIDLSEESERKNVDFSVWIAEPVTKWLEKTQRSMYFTIMDKEDEYIYAI